MNRKDIQVVFNGSNTLKFDVPKYLTYMNPNAFSLDFYPDQGANQSYDLLTLGYILDPLSHTLVFSFTDTSESEAPARYKLRFTQILDSFAHVIAAGAIEWQ